MAGIHFDITGDNRNFINSVKGAQEALKRANDVFKELGKSFDVNSLESKMLTINKVLADMGSAITIGRKKLEELKDAAQEAFNANNIQDFNLLNSQIEKQSQDLELLTEEYKKYSEVRTTIGTLGESDMFSEQVSAPKFYANEEDYKKVQELKEAIMELQEQIDFFTGSEQELANMKLKLSDLKDELFENERAATDAAVALGGELGKQAADAATHLYELNKAVEEQKDIVDNLTDQANAAAEALNKLEGTDDAEALQEATLKYDLLTNSLEQAKDKLANLEMEQQTARESMAEVTVEIDKQNSALVRLLGGQEKFKTITSQLPGPLRGAVDGLQGMTGAAKAFIATPLGAVLAGLILAWQALSSWMERSEEGQLALAKITGYLSGVMEVLKDVVSSVGKFIYKAFTDPKEALLSFGKLLKDQVINRLVAIGDIGFAIGKIISAAFSDNPLEKMTQGMKDLANATAKLATGVDKPLSKINARAKESADISYQRKQLEREESMTKRLVAEYETRSKQLEAKGAKRTKAEEKELKDLNNKIEKAEKDIIDKKIKLQERALENDKFDSIEERNALDRLYEQRSNIEAKYNRKNQRVDNQSLSSSQSAAKQQETMNSKRLQEEMRYQEELKKIDKEGSDARNEARIAAIHNDAEREREQRKIEHEKTIRDIKAKEDDIYKAIYQRRKAIFESDTNNKDKKYENTEAGKLGYAGVKNTMTEEELEYFDDRYSILLAELDKEDALYKRYVRERYMDELQAYKEYVSDYGSLAQQQYAITQYYAEKQKDARNKWEKLSLTRQEARDKEMLNVNAITKGLDWKAIMQGVGSMAKDMMKPMLQQLEAYAQSEGFRKNLDGTQQQSIVNLINELRNYVSTDTEEMQSLTKAMLDFNQSVAAYKKAEQAENAKKAELDKAVAENNAEDAERLRIEFDALGSKTAEARERMINFSNNVNSAADKLKNMAGTLTVVLNGLETWQGVEGFNAVGESSKSLDEIRNQTNLAFQNNLKEDIENGIKDGNKAALKEQFDQMLESGTIDQNQWNNQMATLFGSTTTKLLGGMSDVLSSFSGGMGSIMQSVLGEGLGQIVGIVAQIPRLILDFAAAIKNFVTGVLDSISELLSFKWLEDLVNSILDAVSNLINAIFDLPENLFHVLESIIVNGVGGLVNNILGRVGNIITLGLLGSGGPAEWFNGSNAQEVQETIDRLTDRNKLLQKSIEDLTDEMEDAKGARAIEISIDAKKLQEETNKNLLEMAQAQASYHGDHHSWGYYWGGYNASEIARVNEQLKGQGLSTWNGDLWRMTPEQMKVLRSNVDLWEKIINTGKSYYGEAVAEKLDAYIEQAGKLGEIQEKLYENLTTTTAENVFDDFLNSLYDLADDSDTVFDDIADNWQKMVNKMVINNLIGNNFQHRINAWYEELAKLNEERTADGSKMSNEEYQKRLNELKEKYEDYVKEAEQDLKQLQEMGIVQASAESASKDKSAAAVAADKITYDQADEMTGILRAMQIAGEQRNDLLRGIYGSLSGATAPTLAAQSDNALATSILSYLETLNGATQGSNDLAEIRNIMVTWNDYLLTISNSHRKVISTFGQKMDTIIDKLDDIV